MANEHLTAGIEIERKYIIVKPDLDLIKSIRGSTVSEIVQTYLIAPHGVTHRVRRRTYGGITCYFETRKTRIDKMSVVEEEGEITPEAYTELLSYIDPESHPIHKTRYTLPYESFTLEIDVYPEWQNTAILEVELPDRDIEPAFPDLIHIIREVTGERPYSNAAMSRAFPSEDIIDSPDT